MSEYGVVDVNDKEHNEDCFCPLRSTPEKLSPCRNDCAFYLYKISMCCITLGAISIEDIVNILSTAWRVDLE